MVKPDGWRRIVRATTGSGLEATRAAFWAGFLPHVHKAEPRWRGTKTPTRDTWMSFRSAAPSVKFIARATGSRLTAQCYIDTGDAHTTSELYYYLNDRREAIEASFGAPLAWQRADDHRASFIDADHPHPAGIEDRDQWPDMWAWLVDAMTRLAGAIDPHLR